MQMSVGEGSANQDFTFLIFGSESTRAAALQARTRLFKRAFL